MPVQCTNCGNTIPDNAAFCPQCGHAVAPPAAPAAAPPPAQPPAPPASAAPTAASYAAPEEPGEKSKGWLVGLGCGGIVVILLIGLVGCGGLLGLYAYMHREQAMAELVSALQPAEEGDS
jgi:hypothetical protein